MAVMMPATFFSSSTADRAQGAPALVAVRSRVPMPFAMSGRRGFHDRATVSTGPSAIPMTCSVYGWCQYCSR